MSLKNEIEKTMFKEGIDDRIQDIATFMDIPVENVKKRLKTLTFSDYIEVMTALKTKNKDKIERIMGMPARDPNWKSPIDDVDEGAEMHISPDIARAKTLQHTLPSLDREKYEPRDGLEGPIMTKSGKVVYYDPIEGSYYDPDTDIYLTYEEWKELSEAYSTGSQGPDDEGGDAYVDVDAEVDEPVGATAPMDNATMGKVKAARIQSMQRLGRDNLGGATAAQAADAMDKAEQGKPLTPIQRKAMAYQAQNLDSLAGSPDTRIQFRNLLNRLRKQQQRLQQEQE
jgi:hypothetical protein